MPSPSFPLRARALALALAGALALPGTAVPQVNLPNLGESSFEALSPRMERKIGEQAMQQILNDRDYIDDIEVRQYLNELASDLVSHGGSDATTIEVFAVRDGRINAFAMPGGFIGVHSATVVAAQTESELASVIGHEIGHVTQHHIARQVARQGQDMWISLATLAAAILASRAGGQGPEAALAVGSAVQADQQLRFGREAEREADRVGFQMLNEAGYDGRGMVSFFGRLQRASRFAESPMDIYTRSHPLTIERMSDIQNRVRSVHTKQHLDSEEFYFIRAKLRILQEDSIQGYMDAAEELKAAAENTTGRQRAANLYGVAVAALMRNAAQEGVAALKKAVQALSRENAPIATLQARLQLAQGDAAGALATAEAGSRKYPIWRGLAYAKIDALQAAGRHAEAVAFLRQEIASHTQEPKLFQMAARSHAALGERLEEHRMMAEYYARTGALPSAVEQLQMARREKGDFYQYSQIDARLRDLRAQVEEEMRNNRGERERPS